MPSLNAPTGFGEVGLGGEVRGVSNLDRRLAECAKLGFTTVLCPTHVQSLASKKIKLISIQTLAEALSVVKGK